MHSKKKVLKQRTSKMGKRINIKDDLKSEKYTDKRNKNEAVKKFHVKRKK